MNAACVVKPHKAGLWSLINNVITCLDLYEHVHVDWTGCLYGTPADGNVWNLLFEPTIPPEFGYDTIDYYPDQWLTYKNAGLLYASRSAWRRKCHGLWKRISVRDWIKQNAAAFAAENFKGRTCAVLVRAHGHAGEQLTGRSQPLEEYASAIEREKPDTVHVACGDRETLAWFEKRFNAISHPGTARAATREIDRHLTEPQTVLDASVCLEEVLLLSRAQAFVHPVSNMATGALYINPSLKSVFLP